MYVFLLERISLLKIFKQKSVVLNVRASFCWKRDRYGASLINLNTIEWLLSSCHTATRLVPIQYSRYPRI